MVKNIVANIIGRFWSFLSVFIFVPFYLKLLGSEAYGMISFSTVILGALMFADAGLTATLSREFARVDRNYLHKLNLLATIETIYCFICVGIILGLWNLSPLIATKWLNVEGISFDDAIIYIRMIGVSIAFQFICSLYQGGLMGLQKQVLANSLQIVWSFFRSGVILLPLLFFPSLKVFFGWQIVINLLYFIIIRVILKRQFKTKERSYFSIYILKDIWQYAVGMMAMAIISTLLIQADKVIMSKMLSLSEFGYYTLASMLAQVPLMLVTTIGFAILPRLTELISKGKHNEMSLIFRKGTFIVSSVASLVTFILIVYMPDVLFLWTRNNELTKAVSQVARILCFGSLFQALQLMPYYLAMANGHATTNVKLGIFSVLFLVPTIVLCVSLFGITGAGVPWLIMSIITFFFLGFSVINRFLASYFKQWLLIDTLKPFFQILIITLFFYCITYFLPKGWFIIGYSLLIGLSGLIIMLILFNKEFPEDNILFKLRKLLCLKFKL